MLKKVGAEAILGIILAPLFIWFMGFIISTYQVMAEVNGQKDDIREIKQDVKEIKNFLIIGKGK